MFIIVRSKNNNGKKSKIALCSYCGMPKLKHKLIKCFNCHKKFCYNCLTKMHENKDGSKIMYCHECCINLLRQDNFILFIDEYKVKPKPIKKFLKPISIKNNEVKTIEVKNGKSE